MSQKPTGGTAFPATYKIPNGIQGYPDAEVDDPGMTLRDYFAAQALAGFCSDGEARRAYGIGGEMAERLAEGCYRMADAMLKERAK